MEEIIKKIFESESFIKSDENFLSEKDFQLNLARMLDDEDSKVILEFPLRADDYNNSDIFKRRNAYIDIYCEHGSKKYYIELKYKTKKQSVKRHGLDTKLKTHGAYYDNRYLFYKDIYRLEQVIAKEKDENCTGYILFLTNDDKYFKYPFDKEIKDIKTKYEKKYKLDIKGQYNKFKWQKFKNQDKFQYLLTKVSNYKEN